MKRIKELIAKYYYIISYLFFGGLTTVVNYMVYIPCNKWLNLSAALSTTLAWIVAVIFAYVTNKPFVYKSLDWSPKVVFPEF